MTKTEILEKIDELSGDLCEAEERHLPAYRLCAIASEISRYERMYEKLEKEEA